jgi:SPP1 gp7 family putative phage head morphogenesis protein
VHTFLQAQAPKIANQVREQLARFGKMSQEDEELVERVLRDIDLTGWAALAGDVQPILDDIMREASLEAFKQIHFDVESDPEVLNVVNQAALDYAEARSAEMVGMRVDELGRLVENPNAQWQIADSTRDYLRGDVTQAMEEGWSNDRLAAAIGDSYGFSEGRAMTIARTETAKASNVGALNSYKASGVVDGKQWITADDDLVSEECAENGEAGPNQDGVLLDLSEDFPSGDEAPPVHPNCRCAVIPFIDWNAPATATETGDE